MGEFDGIAHQIKQHLSQAGFVQHHRRGHTRSHAHFQGNALLRRPQVKDVADITEKPAYGDRAEIQAHLAGLDPRQVQNVIDQHQQASTARPDGIEVIALLGICDRIVEQIAVANHRVHRRSDFMGHVGQEFALGTARSLRLPGQPLRLKLGGTEFILTPAQRVLGPDSLIHFQ